MYHVSGTKRGRGHTKLTHEEFYNPGNVDPMLQNNSDNAPFWVTDKEYYYSQRVEDPAAYDVARNDYDLNQDFGVVQNMGNVSDMPFFSGEYIPPTDPSYLHKVPHSRRSQAGAISCNQSRNDYDIRRDIFALKNSDVRGRVARNFSDKSGHYIRHKNVVDANNGKKWYSLNMPKNRIAEIGELSNVGSQYEVDERTERFVDSSRDQFGKQIGYTGDQTRRPSKLIIDQRLRELLPKPVMGINHIPDPPRYGFPVPANYDDVDPFGFDATYYPDTAGKDPFMTPEFQVRGNFKAYGLDTNKTTIEQGIFRSPWEGPQLNSSDYAIEKKKKWMQSNLS